MKRFLKHFRFFDSWCFLFATAFALLFIAAEIYCLFSPGILPKGAPVRILYVVILCLIGYAGGFLYCRRTGDRSVFYRLAKGYLLLYLFLILDFTLFDKTLGRGTFLSSESENLREYYLSAHVNFVPFHTIVHDYFGGLLNGRVKFVIFAFNILGNFCAFMPLSLLFPLIFKRQRRWFVFVPTVVLMVAGIEFLQFWLMLGSCDVDDLILNVSGAVLLYFLLRLPFAKKLLRAATMEPKKTAPSNRNE